MASTFERIIIGASVITLVACAIGIWYFA